MSKETREIAERIATMYTNEGPFYKERLSQWIAEIDKALRDRDERAARIASSEVEHAAQLLTERGDEGRDILNYTDFIKGQKTAAQDILNAIRNGVVDAK